MLFSFIYFRHTTAILFRYICASSPVIHICGHHLLFKKVSNGMEGRTYTHREEKYADLTRIGIEHGI